VHTTPNVGEYPTAQQLKSNPAAHVVCLARWRAQTLTAQNLVNWTKVMSASRAVFKKVHHLFRTYVAQTGKS
jgi:hypothetical protein